MKGCLHGRSCDHGRWSRWPFLLAAIVVGASAAAAMAADASPDLPGRVGRVASVQGTLYRASDDAGGWSQIGLNDPVAQGDNLYLYADGVAEVDFGGGQFRMAAGTNLHVSRLDERQLALFVAAGRLIVRVRDLEPEDGVLVDSPAAHIALVKPGLYRIDVVADRPLTTVVVRMGTAQVESAEGNLVVLPGQSAALRGVTGEPPDVRDGARIDAFDTWSAARDRIYDVARRDAYVSPQMIGQADLDANGAWQSFPDYGAVWFPTVDPEWAPYRFGRWTWVSRWGYTWVDDAPWGYAPFHYGRWAHIGGRWGWCPGAYVARPAWAPALVAWSHGGRGGHGSTFGWTPLGWGEPYRPPWGTCTERCWRRYNRPFAIDAAERPDAPPTHFANGRVPGGVTAVSGAALREGRPVAASRVAMSGDSGFTPTWIARPPAFKPIAPARPAMRGAPPLPPPASMLATQRPSPLPGVAAARTAPNVAPAAAATLRIDDGRGVLRRIPSPPPAVAVERPVVPPPPPLLRTPPAAAPRGYPLPRPVQPASVTPAPAAPLALPRSVPPPAPLPAGAGMPLPAPPTVLPAPAPPIGVPSRGGVARSAPPNPGPGGIPR